MEELGGNNVGSLQLHFALAIALCVMVLSSIQAVGTSFSSSIVDGSSAVAHASVPVVGGVISAAQGDADEVGGLGAFWSSLTRRSSDPETEPWRRVWWRGALATGAFTGSTWMSLRGLRSLATRLAIGPLRATPMLLRGAIAAGIVDIGRLLLIEVVPNLAVFLYDQLGLDSRLGLFGGKEIAGQEVARTARKWTSRLFATGTALTLTVIQEVGGLFWGHDPGGVKEVFLSNYRAWYGRIDQSKEKVWNFFGVRAPSETGDAPRTDWWQGLKEAGKLTALGASADSASKAGSRLGWNNLPFIGEDAAVGLSIGATATFEQPEVAISAAH